MSDKEDSLDEIPKKKAKIDQDSASKLIHFGPSNFEELLKEELYKDNSMLIKHILEEPEKMIITAPRQFGKSANINMLRKFLEILVDDKGSPIDRDSTVNYKLFKENDLKIYKDSEFFDLHFGKYPVIFINFKIVYEISSEEDMLNKFKMALHHSFESHKYVLNCPNIWTNTEKSLDKERFENYLDVKKLEDITKDDVQTSIEFLSDVLYEHFKKKVFILIDDYDAPLSNSFFEKDIDLNSIIDLMTAFLENSLKTNESLDRFLLTGLSYYATICFQDIHIVEISQSFESKSVYLDFFG